MEAREQTFRPYVPTDSDEVERINAKVEKLNSCGGRELVDANGSDVQLAKELLKDIIENHSFWIEKVLRVEIPTRARPQCHAAALVLSNLTTYYAQCKKPDKALRAQDLCLEMCQIIRERIFSSPLDPGYQVLRNSCKANEYGHHFKRFAVACQVNARDKASSRSEGAPSLRLKAIPATSWPIRTV